MRRRAVLGLSLAFLLVSVGCGAERGGGGDYSVSRSEVPASPAPSSAPTARPATAGGGGGSQDAIQTVSLEDANQAQASGEAFNRKIIRNAEMTLQVDDPAVAQQKVSGIAESNGGFVVTSEIAQAGSAGPTVTVSMRVPAERFGAAMEALRAVGTRVVREKSTAQDVTEEYIDLEAHIRTKQALEAQFLEIMKQAKTVPDALEVQRQIADVRGEIERLEGRRRFLENQSSLSTINLTLQTPAPVVATSGTSFGDHIKRAFGDSIDTASAIVIGFIRLLGVGLPIFLLILLPAYFLLRFFWRRMSAKMAAHPPAPQPPQPPPPFSSAPPATE